MLDAGRSFCALLVAVICCAPRHTAKCATRNDSAAGGALWQDGLFSNALLEFTPGGPLDRCAKDLQAYRDDVSNLALWAVKSKCVRDVCRSNCNEAFYLVLVYLILL